MKNKIAKAAAGFLAAISLLTFTACSQQTAAQPGRGQNQNQNGETSIFGKVTAVSGSKITLALGTFGQGGVRSGGRNPGTPPNGDGQRSSSGNNAQQNGQQAGGNRGNGSGANGQSRPSRGMGEAITLTGESKTIEITDTSILTKQNIRGFGSGNRQRQNSGSQNGTSSSQATGSRAQGQAETSASLSDITVGTMLRVTYDASGKLVSVQIIGSMGENSSSSQSK